MRGGKAGFETWLQDARFALRNTRTRPQYTLLSVLTLALGIGGPARWRICALAQTPGGGAP